MTFPDALPATEAEAAAAIAAFYSRWPRLVRKDAAPPPPPPPPPNERRYPGLTSEQVRTVLERISAGVPAKAVAKDYDITTKLIRRIFEDADRDAQ